MRIAIRPLIIAPFALGLIACQVDFEERITPLVIETLPPPMVFVTPDEPETPPPVQTEPATDMPIETVEFEPELETMCTMDNLRLRDQPTTEGAELVVMPPGSQVSWTGEQTEADGFTWYEVQFSAEIQGWAASQWLQAGECGTIAAGGEAVLALIESVFRSGYAWLDENSELEHFGIDLHSRTGNAEMSSPYADEVIVSDACPACTEADEDEGNTLGEFDLDYNWGYGAMMIVEYAYGDLTEAERADLATEGVELEQGQSIYIMMAHLDPNGTFAAAGANLTADSALATIGNSGNSDGAHAHVEVAVTESGLEPGVDEAAAQFWLSTIVDRNTQSEDLADRQGNRIDPTGLFE